ncbi:LolA-like protein [Pseudoalteromonas sp. GB56]
MIRIVTLLTLFLSTFVQADSGQFEQSKLFAGFKQAFVSTGQYTLDDDQLLWHTMTPVESQLKIDATGVYERQANGEYAAQLQTGTYGALLPALLAQDDTALAQFFSAESVAPPESLSESALECVQLVPTVAELKSLFSHFISCAHEQEVAFIGLYEDNGTATEITLTPDR